MVQAWCISEFLQPKLLHFMYWAKDRLLVHAIVHPAQYISVVHISLQSSLLCLLLVWFSVRGNLL